MARRRADRRHLRRATDLKAPRTTFPVTHVSVLERVRSADSTERARALETLATVYWLPLYSYVRLAHRATPQDAEDITQGFFADALRRDLFARYEPSRARFRTFLRTCLDSYAANERKASSRLKRGGDAVTIPLDIAELEGRLRTESDVDATFHREWVRSVFAAAVARLQRTYADTNRSAHFDAFHRYDILGAESDAKPTYAQLAADLGVTPTQVTNWLFSTRRDFRRAVLDTLRDICGSDEELRDESRLLLGVDPPSE